MDRSALDRAKARLTSTRPGEAAIVPITSAAAARESVAAVTATAAGIGARPHRWWSSRWGLLLAGLLGLLAITLAMPVLPARTTAVSAASVVIALGVVLSQRRRARSSVEAAYRSLLREVAERQRAQRTIEESARRLAEAERIAKLGSFELDIDTGRFTWSEGHYRLVGIDPAIAPTFELYRLHIHPDDLATVEAAWSATVEHGKPLDLRCRILTGDGETRHVHARAVATIDDDGHVTRLNGTIIDVSENVHAEEERTKAETRFAVGFEQSATGTVIADLDGRPTMVNPALCRFLGRQADELLGHRWDDFSHPDEVALGAAAMHRVALGDDQYIDERRYLRPDGSVVWALATVALVRDDNGQPAYYFGQFQDITERKTMEVELRYQALHDALTGLPNRTLLLDRVTHSLAGARRRGTSVGVIFLDLDHFKLVNDALGHAVGDVLLMAVARRLADVVRANDTVARLGGDEFVVLCEDIAPKDFAAVASCVGAAFETPIAVQGRELHVSASLGVVIATESHTPDDLLRDADVAMYKAKERGRARIQVFDEQLRQEAADRFDGEAALRRGIASDEFCVFYQPIVTVATGAPVGVEALIRWRDPQRGLVSPAEFVPLAEETGLIVPLGEWVLAEATRQVQQWREHLAGCVDLSVAVNLSARQLDVADLVATVRGALARSGLPPEALHLEITETVLMDDVERSIELLGDLRGLGVRLAVDDFGTGYSSLSYLKRLPVDTLKIDRSFVDGLGSDMHDSSIARAIVNLGTALDLDLLAEGVETERQRGALQELGCQLAQGYLWSPPVAADRFPRWLAGAAVNASVASR